MSGEPVPHEAHLGALASLDRVGGASLRVLLSLGPPAEVWDRVRRGRLPSSVLDALPPPTRAAVPGWARAASTCDPVRSWARWRERGIGVVSIGSPSYPSCLLDDPDPPVLLFHRGDLDVLAAPRVAVVGTRRATGYGRRVAHDLGRNLAAAGVCVVSGLALGIDAAAHHGAVDGRAGPAAVVGGGVDAPGPATNAALAREVVDRGVVLSEAPPGTRPEPWRFPVRNRILAGLAQVVVVVESAERGGSMHTVEQAQRRDRTVLAVPGPVESAASAGTNALLRDGAGVCTGVDDVLVALGLSRAGSVPAPTEERPDPAGDAGAVLGALGFTPVPVEALARDLGLDLARLSVALGELEALGWAERRGPFVERIARRGTGPGEPP
ncbi:DNA-processing protein DprA [Dermatobacter hominis]|uniref:DNA-processing protein DprA n=1 Tax=Dermatobacter hominis TaxID=2884263 RepID=UPI001D10952D|nr:DNA-processing protein DprA [Dermatobacter hominis]UDY36868.1 DNA-processing protein DprA [Dermatobacter hominis]